MSWKVSYRSLFGLPLLWAAAYFVPALKLTSIYLMPTRDLVNVVISSLLALIAGIALLLMMSRFLRYLPRLIARYTATLGFAMLGVIAIKVVISAIGPAWQDLIPVEGNFALNLRLYKYGVCLAVGLFAWLTRNHLGRWDRVLSSLGLAFGAIALVRLAMLGWSSPSLPPPSSAGNGLGPTLSSQTSPGEAVQSVLPRRVVWVLFDETDFARLYPPSASDVDALPNFTRLAHAAMFASNANSPASATLYSIPALLLGVPIAGRGVRIDRTASLSLETIDQTYIPFDQATSIFGALERSGRTASVLGFYQPYCRLFKLQRCDSYAWPEAGGLESALVVNLPDFLVPTGRSGTYFGEITEKMVQLLPQYLARDDALTYLHLNLPHLPANYADKMLGLSESSAPLIEYSRNLVVADRVLGEIIRSLEGEAKRRDVLLVVSTDHWLRRRSYRDPGKEASRRIPFIAWKVGETLGFTIAFPISTVHTEKMILDYLDGKVSSQSELAEWWRAQPVFPSFIAPTR